MLILNFNKLFELRGIKKPLAFLVENGLTYSIAWRYQNGKATRIDLHHLESICYKLDCTPNDVLEWRPDEKKPDKPGHPMKALQAKKDQPSIVQLLKEIPVDKIGEIEKLLSELKNQKSGG